MTQTSRAKVNLSHYYLLSSFHICRGIPHEYGGLPIDAKHPS